MFSIIARINFRVSGFAAEITNCQKIYARLSEYLTATVNSSQRVTVNAQKNNQK